MSASEKLKRLEWMTTAVPVGKPWTQMEQYVAALPALIAVVEAAEETRLFLLELPLENTYESVQDLNEDIADMRKRIYARLTALDEALGDVT